MASPTKQQAGHAVPPGVRMLPTSCSVHHAGFPSKLPAFWEQETTLYHQENMRGCGGGTQAVTELAGRVELLWMESHLSSALCPWSWKPWGPARYRAFPANHCPLGVSHSQHGLATAPRHSAVVRGERAVAQGREAPSHLGLQERNHTAGYSGPQLCAHTIRRPLSVLFWCEADCLGKGPAAFRGFWRRVNTRGEPAS